MRQLLGNSRRCVCIEHTTLLWFKVIAAARMLFVVAAVVGVLLVIIGVVRHKYLCVCSGFCRLARTISRSYKYAQMLNILMRSYASIIASILETARYFYIVN